MLKFYKSSLILIIFAGYAFGEENSLNRSESVGTMSSYGSTSSSVRFSRSSSRSSYSRSYSDFSTGESLSSLSGHRYHPGDETLSRSTAAGSAYSPDSTSSSFRYSRSSSLSVSRSSYSESSSERTLSPNPNPHTRSASLAVLHGSDGEESSSTPPRCPTTNPIEADDSLSNRSYYSPFSSSESHSDSSYSVSESHRDSSYSVPPASLIPSSYQTTQQLSEGQLNLFTRSPSQLVLASFLSQSSVPNLFGTNQPFAGSVSSGLGILHIDQSQPPLPPTTYSAPSLETGVSSHDTKQSHEPTALSIPQQSQTTPPPSEINFESFPLLSTSESPSISQSHLLLPPFSSRDLDVEDQRDLTRTSTKGQKSVKQSEKSKIDNYNQFYYAPKPKIQIRSNTYKTAVPTNYRDHLLPEKTGPLSAATLHQEGRRKHRRRYQRQIYRPTLSISQEPKQQEAKQPSQVSRTNAQKTPETSRQSEDKGPFRRRYKRKIYRPTLGVSQETLKKEPPATNLTDNTTQSSTTKEEVKLPVSKENSEKKKVSKNEAEAPLIQQKVQMEPKSSVQPKTKQTQKRTERNRRKRERRKAKRAMEKSLNDEPYHPMNFEDPSIHQEAREYDRTSGKPIDDEDSLLCFLRKCFITK